MVLKFVCCVVIEIISLQIGMPQANALYFIGYMDIVLFLTIGEPEIYQLKSLGKSATFFYLGDQ
jgi:hypothetical protein